MKTEMDLIPENSYRVCQKCGCTDNRPCTHPDHGTCWWIDDNHDHCSHCYIDEIADDPATEHPKKRVPKIKN